MDLEVCEEIVHSLSQDACPVYRIDSAELVGRVEFAVGEEGFYDALSRQLRLRSAICFYNCKKETNLAIVKCALNGEIEYVRVGDRRHLGFLNWRNTSFRVEDEDGNICFVT